MKRFNGELPSGLGITGLLDGYEVYRKLYIQYLNSIFFRKAKLREAQKCFDVLCEKFPKIKNATYMEMESYRAKVLKTLEKS